MSHFLVQQVLKLTLTVRILILRFDSEFTTTPRILFIILLSFYLFLCSSAFFTLILWFTLNYLFLNIWRSSTGTFLILNFQCFFTAYFVRFCFYWLNWIFLQELSSTPPPWFWLHLRCCDLLWLNWFVGGTPLLLNGFVFLILF